jgi:hypothetical protein
MHRVGKADGVGVPNFNVKVGAEIMAVASDGEVCRFRLTGESSPQLSKVLFTLISSTGHVPDATDLDSVIIVGARTKANRVVHGIDSTEGKEGKRTLIRSEHNETVNMILVELSFPLLSSLTMITTY